MFEELIQKFDRVVRNLRGMGKLSEKNMEESMREIRRVLLDADVHFKVVKDFVSAVQSKALGTDVAGSVTPGQMVVKIVHDEMVRLLGGAFVPLRFHPAEQTVMMLVGLQGSGKTTLAAKLGLYLKKQGHYPLLAACDVVRPAAAEQLVALGKSSEIPVFTLPGAEPVRIAEQALAFARTKNLDVVVLDTAGRLHIDEIMMAELEEIKKKLKPADVLFVADGMSGQDAVKSAQRFQERIDFDGVVLTKMDGDARGGAALSIRAATGKPVQFVSTGEKLNALEPFHPERMASRILGMGDVVSLVEKAQEAVNRETSEKLAGKINKQAFDFQDFLDQLQQVRRMGPMDQLLGMIPGAGAKLSGLKVDESSMSRAEAIIRSMTEKERRSPHMINGSRRKRIAAGSGTTVQDVNSLLKQFQGMQTMMKRMGKMSPKKLSRMGFGF